MGLSEFLVKAKQKTYAGEGKATLLKNGSKELIYSEKEFLYRDRYFGFNPFAGEEIVFKNKKAIWIMNYFGRISSKEISSKEIYNFLKKALLRVEKEHPFRGPVYFKENDFEYFNKSEGFPNSFSGKEFIRYKGKEVYRAIYHGGEIKK